MSDCRPRTFNDGEDGKALLASQVRHPGRGKPMTKADVQAYKAKWDTFRTRAGDAVKKGVSKDEFIAKRRLPYNVWTSGRAARRVSDSSAKLEPSPR